MSSLKKLDNEYYNYFIVEFDDGYELVPQKWITRQTRECYWPVCSSLKVYDWAVQSMDDPKDDWKKCHIEKILAGAKTFLRGKEKLKRAGNNSSLTTDVDDEKKSRHSRALKRQFSPATSASDGEDDDDNIPIPQLPKIPANINRMLQGGGSANVAATPTDIVRCHFKDATDTNIEIPIKKWLSKAKERLQRDARKNMNSDENNN